MPQEFDMPHTSDELSASERDRLISELYDANRRLSGTLRIVLDTLDTHDVRTLFNRVAAEIRDVLEATGVVVYAADDNSFRLQSRAGDFDRSTLAVSIPFGSGFADIVSSSDCAVRLQLVEQDMASSSQESVLQDESGGHKWEIPAAQVPPYRSFICVPVQFGGSIIAFILAGWTDAQPTNTEDAQLLDAVTQYLSAQIMAALSEMRSKQSSRLDHAATVLHDKLSALGNFRAESFSELAQGLHEALKAQTYRVEETSDGTVVILASMASQNSSSGAEIFEFPLGVEELYRCPVAFGATVVPVTHDSKVSAWLREQDLPCVGAFVDAGQLPGASVQFLTLRSEERGQFNQVELDFIRRIIEDLEPLAQGIEARDEDKRISQALQTGMRNELQQVDGITAEGIYSSATAEAFVGGDFYDLIRLPNQRFCVIMGDVSGKGVEAASMSAAVRTSLGAYAWVGLSPAEMVRSLNDFLIGFSRLETFATIFVGIGDLAAGTLTYCSAGHPPALLLTQAHELDVLGVQSGVVGAFEEMEYRDGTVQLSPGDTLLLYTDGATEARALDGSFFGEDGLRETALRFGAMDLSPREFLEQMLSTLDEFTSTHLEDDVALVAVRVDG